MTSDKWIEIVKTKEKENLQVQTEKKRRKEKRKEIKKNTGKNKKVLGKKTVEGQKGQFRYCCGRCYRRYQNKTSEKQGISQNLKVDCYVIVRYDQSFYPAKVIEIDEVSAQYQAMVRSGLN